MSYLWCIDHDGTASLGDIGRDYLYRFVPGIGSPEEFVEEVRKIRTNPEYREEILRGADYEKGLELALLLSYHGVKQDDVRESGKKAENSLRDGFSEFLRDPERGRVIMFSAGVKDWLMNYYMQKFPNTNFDVVGTSLYVDEQGRYTRIKKPCGRESKPDRIEEVVQGMNGGIIKIGVGDSDGDRGMFDYVLRDGGLAIGIGDPEKSIKGDINFSKDVSWAPVVFAGRMYAHLMEHTEGDDAGEKKKPILPQLKEALEACSYVY